MLLAERGRLDSRTSRAFADAGLAHLLAISGLHVGILAGAAVAAAGLVVAGRARFPVAAGLVLGYVFLIGMPPAALRAALLFCGYAASRARGSPVCLTELLGAAGIVAILVDPLSLLDPGFQLSFSGFAGLLLGDRLARRVAGAVADRYPALGVRGSSGLRRRQIRQGLARLGRALGASAGAFALTAPIAAWHFQRTAPISIVSSLIGSPIVALCLLALAGVLVLPEWPAHILAGAATLLTRLLFGAADYFASLPLGHATVGRPGPIEWLAAGSCLAALFLLGGGRSILRVAPLVGLAVAVSLSAPALQGLKRAGRPLLCTLDVGQGDAAVLRTGRGHWLVFDAGPRHGTLDAGRRTVLPFLLSNGAREIELLVLTHPDLDHAGGAAALFERLPVRRVLDSAWPVPKPAYADYLRDVAAEGSEWLVGRPGARLRIDDIELLVLGPLPGPWTPGAGGVEAGSSGRPLRANEASLSFRIATQGGFRYLNAGDALAAAELGMTDRWSPDTLRADVLKVSHHGSRTSSAPRFIRAVSPQLAVISAGAANRYGHPHPLTLARLDVGGVRRIWRTDVDGTACVRVEGDGFWYVVGS
ncbi:MAG: ComEC/Rec2 family competence protein [Gemmatimonadota bacterium]|nr:MAG: ComEC/Rec2 family competence protein [Gemmatimonadota bacterium]